MHSLFIIKSPFKNCILYLVRLSLILKFVWCETCKNVTKKNPEEICEGSSETEPSSQLLQLSWTTTTWRKYMFTSYSLFQSCMRPMQLQHLPGTECLGSPEETKLSHDLLITEQLRRFLKHVRNPGRKFNNSKSSKFNNQSLIISISYTP